VREREYYEYEYDEDVTDVTQEDRVHESEFTDYTDSYEYADAHEYSNPQEYGNEMARSAVERFLEAETVDEPEPESVSIPSAASHHDGEEEYMTRLADARKERQRRREQNPVPRPAVRVNVERPRRSHPVVVNQPVTDEEMAPMAEEDFNSFRERYSEPHVMTPREVKTDDRTRNKNIKRLDSEPLAEGPSPIRYMLAVIAFGLLALIAVLSFSNRNLRLDRDRYQAMATNVDYYIGEATRLQLDLDASRAQNAAMAVQIEALMAAGNNIADDPYTPIDDTSSRPSGEDGYVPTAPPQQPPPPAPAIHIVQRGDALSRIANQHFGSSAQRYIDLIVSANNLPNQDEIYIGQELTIPVLES